VPNPFIGQSLLRRYGERQAKATFGTGNGGPAGGLRTGPWKYWVRFDPHHEYLYDLRSGHDEERDLSADPEQSARMNEFYSTVKGIYGENNRLIEENRIWNWKYWPKN
jgi:arylsulfatase A-like enzyme